MYQPNQSTDDIAISLTDFVCSTLALACSRDRSEISPGTQIRDLHIDSLTFVSVLAQVEAVYGFELTPDALLGMMEAACVSQLVDRLAPLVDRGAKGVR